jgi:hypothetical protein
MIAKYKHVARTHAEANLGERRSGGDSGAARLPRARRGLATERGPEILCEFRIDEFARGLGRVLFSERLFFELQQLIFGKT